jgi:hypothetical protein
MSGRATVFSLVGTIAYTVAYYVNLPLFRYYPLSGVFSFYPRPNAGFAIFWYGWIAFAIATGAIATFVFPRRWLNRVPGDLSWIGLTLAIFATLIYEQRWLF